LTSGVPELDVMLGGGGPAGSGKTILATQFLAEGMRAGEPGVIAAFEKSPNQLLSQRLSAMTAAWSLARGLAISPAFCPVNRSASR